MKNESGKRLSKICRQCEKQSSCARSSMQQRQCYQTWYNRTQRDPQAEKLRQALFRHKNFSDSMWSRSKSQALRAKMAFDLDREWFKTELVKGVCAATGMNFEIPKYQPGARGKRSAWTPSIDRIDNAKGYVKSNCQLVVWMYNLAKSNYTVSDIVRMCKALVDKEGEKMHQEIVQ